MTPVIVKPAMTGRGSLATLMDAIHALHEQVSAQLESQGEKKLRVYRWRPRGIPELPCIYPWMGDSPFDIMDLARGRDTVLVNSRLGIRHTDVDEEMAKLEVYADAYRHVVDPSFWTPRIGWQQPLLDGAATEAHRAGMAMVAETFGDVPVLAIQFPLSVKLDRNMTE